MVAIAVLPGNDIGTSRSAEVRLWHGKYSGVPVGRGYGKRCAALITLNSGNLPASDQCVRDAAPVGKSLSLAEWKLVGVTQHNSLRCVVLTEPLLDLQVVRVQRAGSAIAVPCRLRRILRIGIGEGLGPGIVCKYGQAP